MKKRVIFSAVLLALLANPSMACENGRFHMVAITAGQTAQVNVVNEGNGSTRSTCHIAVEFADRAGNVINDVDATGFALRPGQVASTVIDHPNLRTGERFHVQAHVRKFELKAAGRSECDAIHATIEVFDNDTGKTTIVSDLPDE
ncbi:MAG TPA: hypothetical protein VGK44_11685 [Casimicrobiaceae bacterium]|jgi:hypothetical protein